jgi:hypothetical protein
MQSATFKTAVVVDGRRLPVDDEIGAEILRVAR